eukprot:TCONS_00063528-protein
MRYFIQPSIIFLLLVTRGFSMSTWEHEARLMTHLFGNNTFTSLTRPNPNGGGALNVTIGLAYVQLMDLDEHRQMLKSNIWIRQYWTNEALAWNPTDYGNISVINIDPVHAWLPDIVLYNNARAISAISGGVLYQFKKKLVLHFDGSIQWFAPTIIQTSCHIDPSLYPFDRQNCSVILGSWTHHGFELDVFAQKDSIDTEFYQESSEFHLVTSQSRKLVQNFSCCAEPYPLLVFDLVFQRHSTYYFINIIIPTALITCLSCLSFVLPSGERVTIGLNVFFTITFINLYNMQKVPQTSTTSLMNRFLHACTVLTAFCMCSNACVLIMLSLKNVQVPFFIKYLIFEVIAPSVGLHTNEMFSSTKRREDSSWRIKTDFQVAPKTIYTRIEKELRKDFWRCCAQTLDRCCFIAFVVLFLSLSLNFVTVDLRDSSRGKLSS